MYAVGKHRTRDRQRHVAPYRFNSVRCCTVPVRSKYGAALCVNATYSYMFEHVAMAVCTVLQGFIQDLVVRLAGCALSSRPSFTAMTQKQINSRETDVVDDDFQDAKQKINHSSYIHRTRGACTVGTVHAPCTKRRKCKPTLISRRKKNIKKIFSFHRVRFQQF